MDRHKAVQFVCNDYTAASHDHSALYAPDRDHKWSVSNGMGLRRVAGWAQWARESSWWWCGDSWLDMKMDSCLGDYVSDEWGVPWEVIMREKMLLLI